MPCKGDRDGERSTVADVLRMLHRDQLAEAIGWAVSKTDNTIFAYDEGRAGVAQLVEQRLL